jgi:hypothetical protein
MRKLIICVLLGGLVSTLLGLGAQAQLSLEVEVGLGDQYLPNHYTPIWVRIIYDGPPLEGELVLRQESQRRLEEVKTLELRRPVRLGGRARPRYELYLPLSDSPPPGGDEPELSVLFESQGRAIASRRVALADLVSSKPLVLMLSDGGYLQVLPTGERVINLTAEELPGDWRGYSGVRRLYLGRFNPNEFEPAQREALRRWLVRGGELVVLAGQNAYLQDAPWLREIIAFEVKGVRWVEELGAHAAVGHPSGEILYSEAGLPLLVRSRIGRGRIYFSALDLRGAGETERAIWTALAPEKTEALGPLPLGPELFRKMELRYPDKLLMGGLLILYIAGVGLFSLWALRQPHWSGWRVLIITAAWLGLFTGTSFAYLKRPEFGSRVQALEIGLIWRSAQGIPCTSDGADDLQPPCALIQSWYSALAKRTLPFELAAGPDTLLLPLEGTSFTLQLEPDHLRLRFLPAPLEAGSVNHLYLEDVVPLPIEAEVEEGQGAFRGPLVRVYNGSSWPLRGVVFWREGIYYPLGDLAAGSARETAISGLGAGAWLRADGWDFEDRVRWSLFKAAQAELEYLKPDWTLFAWVEGTSLAGHPAEDRWTIKLLILVGPERA